MSPGRRTLGDRLRGMLLAVYGPAQVSPEDPRDVVDRERQMRGRRGTSSDPAPGVRRPPDDETRGDDRQGTR